MPTKRFPYSSHIKTPYRFTLSYFAIIFILAYALGIQVVSPIDIPTGFSVFQANATTTTSTVLAEPRPTTTTIRPAEGVKTEGFNMFQPIAAKADLVKGTLELRFMKVMPSKITLEGIEVRNHENGKRCAESGYDQPTGTEDTFSLHAAGCDTTIGGDGAVAYDVITQYEIAAGDRQLNTGRILVAKAAL